jgi:hypothetical protein
MIGGGFIQQDGDMAPNVSALMGYGQRKHELARLVERRDCAAVFQRDRLASLRVQGMRQRS